MTRIAFSLRLAAVAGLCLFVASNAFADGPAGPHRGGPQAGAKHPPFADVVGDAERIEGLINLYQKGNRLFAELTPGDLNRDLMVAIEIARGIGQMPLVGGMTWGFGDDWIWQFRKVDDRIEVVRRNVRFRADRGTPLEKSVHMSYTDSVLFSLPIITTSPSGGAVVDLTPVFMSDLPEFTHLLRGFMFAPDRSSWSHIKGFKDNVEIEVAATYASGGMASLDTVPDTRGVTLYVHYSVSRLPQTGYQSRLADDRVGYFLTVIKDFSKSGGEDQFVRYVEPLGPAQGRAFGRRFAAGHADHLLDRKDGALSVPGGRARRNPGVEQGFREGRLLQRHRGPPAVRGRHLGPRGH